jgi:beta-xylosidase
MMDIKKQLPVPGKLWLDTDGQPIQAHGGGMLVHDQTYYWYGENKNGDSWLPECNLEWDGYRVDAIGINCYSSNDLLNWKNEGIVLPAVKDDHSHDLHTSKVIERPKVIYNKETRQFIMWMHIDSMDYQYARAGVAISPSPTGPFRYLESVRPNDFDSRDMTVFQDIDDHAYLINSTVWNSELHISPLNKDYLGLSGKFERVIITDSKNRGPEAPILFKYKKKYFMITSQCTGWDPNPARYAIADHILGPWKELGNPCIGPGADTTFDSQGTFVFYLKNDPGSFIFMADRWKKTDLRYSQYLWLPIKIENERISIQM